MKKMNVGDTDLMFRFMLGISLFIYGIVGGLDSPVAFAPNLHQWLVIGIEPAMGTLETPWNFVIMSASLVVLYTAATRYCILYPKFSINTCRISES